MTDKYVSMNPEIKERWITALTDGSYTQGEGYLRIDAPDEATGENLTTFCCLGVLCDLAIKDGLDISTQIHLASDSSTAMHTYYNDEDAFLPRAVREWAGMEGGYVDGSGTFAEFSGPSANPVKYIDKYGQENEDNTLIGLNDGGMNFAGIAKVIQERF